MSKFVAYPHMYGIAKFEDGGREKHARALAHGLAMMPDNFVCEVCYWCKGEGVRQYEGCHVCDGTGLTQAGGVATATDSQRHQVLVTASRSMLLDFEVNVL